MKSRKGENVIYGIISGMALFMDVYQPENSNHRGNVFIAGSDLALTGRYAEALPLATIGE